MMIARIIGTALGILLGVGGAAAIGMHAAELEHEKRVQWEQEGRCWEKGGVYKDGTCSYFSGAYSDEAKVCMAMKGYYAVTDDKFTCYDTDGKVKEMPSLEGKELRIMDDGTLVLLSKS